MIKCLLAFALTCLASIRCEDSVLPRLKIGQATDLTSDLYDVVVVLNDNIFMEGEPALQPLADAIMEYYALDPTVPQKMQIIPFLENPSKRLIYAPTGILGTDVSDSRQFYDTAKDAAKLVYSLGFRKPLFVLGPMESKINVDAQWVKGSYPNLLMSLGALQGFYMPLILREDPNFKFVSKFDYLGIYGVNQEFINTIAAIEDGRIVTRDICAAGPERMPPPKVEEYYRNAFPIDSGIDIKYLQINYDNTYPMIQAANRAVKDVPKYAARVIKMKYETNNDAKVQTVILVGKGSTFNTGGTNLRTGGTMSYMRKEKCGAAAIAGFMKTASILKPANLRLIAKLAFVRNGIGANAYVDDEIITSKANIRARIENTNAEGRTIMVDMLAEAVVESRAYVDVQLFTIGTLTDAAGLAFKHFTAIMDNGPAREKNVSENMKISGQNIADFVEVVILRKEDYNVNRPYTEYEDILQFNHMPDTSIYRAFQSPAAFMAVSSGLDNWGLQTQSKKIAYTHLDCSASVGVKYIEATAAPTSLLISHYLLPKVPEFKPAL